jgi:hypothetical protein
MQQFQQCILVNIGLLQWLTLDAWNDAARFERASSTWTRSAMISLREQLRRSEAREDFHGIICISQDLI